MKLLDKLFSARCENCGTPLINQKVYTTREETPTGIYGAFSSEEPKLFDAIDYPKCGMQKILGRRYRAVEKPIQIENDIAVKEGDED